MLQIVLLEGPKVEFQDTGIENCSVVPDVYKTRFNGCAEDLIATWFDSEMTALPKVIMKIVGRLIVNQLWGKPLDAG